MCALIVFTILFCSHGCFKWGLPGDICDSRFTSIGRTLRLEIRISAWGFPSGSVVKNPLANQCKRPGCDPWVGRFPWRKKWQLTPVLLPEKSHKQRSLAGYSLWGCKRVRHDLVTEQRQVFVQLSTFSLQFGIVLLFLILYLLPTRPL